MAFGVASAAMSQNYLVDVPYKGAGPAITDLVAGQVQVMLLNLAPVKGLIQNGRLRALAVAGPTRSANLPDVATAAESGLPGYSVVGWYGMLLPAGVPRALKARLHGDVVKTLRADDVRQRLSAENTEPIGNTPEEFAAFLKQEIAKFAAVITRTGVKAD